MPTDPPAAPPAAPHPGPRRSGVLGRPVGHSRSPDLHRAAHAALGLTGWTYDRLDCDDEGLPDLVDGLGPEWVGLSVTMPGKLAALQHATHRSARAEAVGAANTLLRTADGWWADCTDVDGITGALAELDHGHPDLVGRPVVVLGAGGTARAVVASLAAERVGEVVLGVREPARAAGALATAERLGVPARAVALDALAPEVAAAPVCVSTVPAGAQDGLVDVLAPARALLDVVYAPWPTAFATGVQARGGHVVGGSRVLLHQAFGQVAAFTGRPAPREAMAAALDAPPGP